MGKAELTQTALAANHSDFFGGVNKGSNIFPKISIYKIANEMLGSFTKKNQSSALYFQCKGTFNE